MIAVIMYYGVGPSECEDYLVLFQPALTQFALLEVGLVRQVAHLHMTTMNEDEDQHLYLRWRALLGICWC
jgi:hypothetical protein